MGAGILSFITRLRGLWNRLADREYREAYLDEAINTGLSSQIYALRVSRGLTQAEVASRTGIAQPTLSRLESDAHGVTTATLKRLGNVYDVALSVRFVPFGELAREVAQGKVDREIKSFEHDVPPYNTWTLHTDAIAPSKSEFSIDSMGAASRGRTIVPTMSAKSAESKYAN